jgi:hypothetical protein
MTMTMTSFRFEDVVADLEEKIDFLTAIVLHAQGYTPTTWAEEILEEEAGGDAAAA